MIYLQIFLAFFIPNIIGYGGGPAIIPLIEAEVVGRLDWMNSAQFAETLAIGNALPSPIATKMAGQIGFEVAGIAGAAVAIFATVAPSLLLLILALGVLNRFRDSPRVKRMSNWVRPTIAVMMGMLTLAFFQDGIGSIGWLHTAILAAAAAVGLFALKLHPALLIAASLLYGALLLS